MSTNSKKRVYPGNTNDLLQSSSDASSTSNESSPPKQPPIKRRKLTVPINDENVQIPSTSPIKQRLRTGSPFKPPSDMKVMEHGTKCNLKLVHSFQVRPDSNQLIPGLSLSKSLHFILDKLLLIHSHSQCHFKYPHRTRIGGAFQWRMHCQCGQHRHAGRRRSGRCHQ